MYCADPTDCQLLIFIHEILLILCCCWCELLTLHVAPVDPPRLDLQEICRDIIVWDELEELGGKYLSSPSPGPALPTSDKTEVSLDH